MDNKIKMLHKIIKEIYPEAVSVKVFANYQEIEIAPTYRNDLDGVSMRNISGEWVE